MTLTPQEATPRALALMTVAHEIYSDTAENDLAGFDDETLASVLADGSGEIDWKAISLALAMLGHLLLDTIPDTLYDAAEDALRNAIADREGGKPENYVVQIKSRLTGTQLLQHISLHIASMSPGDA